MTIREATPDEAEAVLDVYEWLLGGLCSVCLDIASERAWAWARDRDATHLELDSGDARVDAHRFYERLEPSWTGRRFS